MGRAGQHLARLCRAVSAITAVRLDSSFMDAILPAPRREHIEFLYRQDRAN